jgi:hypothetical protein
MAFQLPPDDPIQMLVSQAEALGGIVAAYHNSLGRNGIVSEELVGELTLQYGEHMLEKLYPTKAQPTPPPPPIVEE